MTIPPFSIYRKAALFGAVLVFITSFYFVDCIWSPLIDPAILERPAGPDTAIYWHWWYLNSYLRQFIPWAILARMAPIGDRVLKGALTFIAAIHFYSILDLILTGNQAGTIYEPLGLIGATIYTAFIAWKFWKAPAAPDSIEAGKVYLISRPPRTVLELIATWISPRWAGSVSVYANGYLYGFSPKSLRYEIMKAEGFRLREYQTAKEVPTTDPATIHVKALAMQGARWKLNCFGMAKKLLT